MVRMVKTEVHTGLWFGNLKERDHVENLDIAGRITLDWGLRKQDGRVWTGLIWLSRRTAGVYVNAAGNILVSHNAGNS